MPIINVIVSPQPSATVIQAIAKGLTEITARVLRKNPAITAVAIRPLAAEHWVIGEASLAAQGKASFWLDIAVVDGTNTKDEKAQYLAEVFAFMARALDAPLHEESYAWCAKLPPTPTATAESPRSSAISVLSSAFNNHARREGV